MYVPIQRGVGRQDGTSLTECLLHGQVDSQPWVLGPHKCHDDGIKADLYLRVTTQYIKVKNVCTCMCVHRCVCMRALCALGCVRVRAHVQTWIRGTYSKDAASGEREMAWSWGGART